MLTPPALPAELLALLLALPLLVPVPLLAALPDWDVCALSASRSWPAADPPPPPPQAVRQSVISKAPAEKRRGMPGVGATAVCRRANGAIFMAMNSAWKRRCYIAEKVSTVSLESHVRASPGVARPDWRRDDGAGGFRFYSPDGDGTRLSRPQREPRAWVVMAVRNTS